METNDEKIDNRKAETCLDDFNLEIKHRYSCFIAEFGCVLIDALERVRIFCSAIKHGYRCFISILTRQDRLYLSNLLHCFGKAYIDRMSFGLAEGKLNSEGLERGPRAMVTAICYRE